MSKQCLRLVLGCLVATSIVGLAHAGRLGSGTSSGYSRSANVSASSKSPSTKSPDSSTSYRKSQGAYQSGKLAGYPSRPKPTQGSSKSRLDPIGSIAGGLGLHTGRSLLDRGRGPSSRLTQVIHERESSGPGWLGTAFLISLLSNNDLSAADKKWVEDKIDEVERDKELTGSLVGATSSPALLRFDGIKPKYGIGERIVITVSLVSSSGKGIAEKLACKLGHLPVRSGIGYIGIAWSSNEHVAQILSCTAKGIREKRVIVVG